jgi:Cu-Zn family superoxide dismutase
MSKPWIAVAAAAAAWIAGCTAMSPAGPAAVAQLRPTAGNVAAGTVRFEQAGNKVIVVAELSGLKANAEHGFHVHEKGDCSAPDAMSAGGHFNPGGKPHGHYGKAERHAGDMPNLKAGADGVARLRWESDLLAVGAGPADVIGRSVVVHRDPDDYASQPAGNSGPRLACGVIVAAR